MQFCCLLISPRPLTLYKEIRWQKILREYEISDETIKAVMMLYKNTQAKVQSLDGDADFFDVCARVLQSDTLTLLLVHPVLQLCIIYLNKSTLQSGFHYTEF